MILTCILYDFELKEISKVLVCCGIETLNALRTPKFICI